MTTTDGYPTARVIQDDNPRCWRCNRLLAVLLTRPWVIRCSRCKATNQQGI